VGAAAGSKRRPGSERSEDDSASPLPPPGGFFFQFLGERGHGLDGQSLGLRVIASSGTSAAA
jgi:hypothetical protein